MCPVTRKYACAVNNRGADQPLHLHSLISTMAVCYLDSVIPCICNSLNFKTYSQQHHVNKPMYFRSHGISRLQRRLRAYIIFLISALKDCGYSLERPLNGVLARIAPMRRLLMNKRIYVLSVKQF